uniref:PHD-type domain-containing protein n=1 Tax=Populus trichocarpa TaxID=3694 RepID=A0A2K1Z192_POPTR
MQHVWIYRILLKVLGIVQIDGGNFARPTVIRLTRVGKIPEYNVGDCVVCSAKKEFHVGCLRESGLCDLEEIPEDNWFCCQDCNNIYVALRNSVSTGVQKIPASLLNIINRKHVEKGLLVDEAAYDVQWQILTGKSRSREDLSLLFGGCCNFSREIYLTRNLGACIACF